MLQSSSPAAAPGTAARPGLVESHIWEVLVIAIPVSLLLISSIFLCRRKLFPVIVKRWTRKGSLRADKLMLRKFKLEELGKATNNFSTECLLGSGAFGNVYKGSFHDGGTMAIKRAHAGSYQSIEEFRNEVRLLSRVRHRNLVGLVGFCEEPGRKGRNLNWRQRVTVAIHAAKGIAHLHGEGIIHRDIKPSNILIGEGMEAKVSDFGLVKTGPIGDQSHVSSQVKGTPGYLDPAYCSSFHLTPFTDVYSFGVILLQLVSARPAVDSTQNHSSYHIAEWARPSIESGNVGEIVDANLLSEPCNMVMMQKMGELGLKCVAERPKQRPTMTQLWQQLEQALSSAENFINKQPPRSPGWSMLDGSQHHQLDHSQSIVSIDGIRLQKFQVEMDTISVQSSASLRRFKM